MTPKARTKILADKIDTTKILIGGAVYSRNLLWRVYVSELPMEGYAFDLIFMCESYEA